MNPGKPVNTLSNRELLEETAEALRYLRELVTELEPLIAVARTLRLNGGPSYVQAAGLRRAIRKGRDATASTNTATTAARSELGPAWPGPGPAD